MAYQELNSKPYNKKIVWKIALNASIGSFIFGYNTGVFNSNQLNVAATLGWGGNENLYISIMAAMMPFGGLFGALFAGTIAQKIGRRKALMLMDVINIFGCVFFICPYTSAFALGRFITGYTTGSFSVLSPLYIGETSPPDIMGTIGSLCGLILAVGIMVAYAMALPLPTGDYHSDPLNYWWIFMFVFQALFTAFQFFVLWKVYKEDTPIWLLSKKQDQKALKSSMQYYNEDEAVKVIQKLRASMSADRDKTLEAIEKEVPETATSEKPKEIDNSKRQTDYTYKELLCCSKKSRKMMRLGILVNVFQVAAGVDALFAYTTKIFSELGGGVFESRAYTVVFGVVTVISTLAVFPVVDRFNRKTLILLGNGGMFITMFFLGLFAEEFSGSGPIPSLVFVLLYVLAWSIGLGTICWVYSGEILTSRAISICIGVNWIVIISVIFTFPHIASWFSIGIAFWVYAVISALGIVYFLIEFVETKGLDSTQIKEAFDKYK
ncbi:unnamed protein product [Blepharisma stoltei]|uniref:Hexose transporter 1 n=1 Tax=Blepharisma stoltei TaxID=1481888 RepID=A0AAU9J598_9CILI|nr:unnamed protein product [Blepharisma stoltei]